MDKKYKIYHLLVVILTLLTCTVSFFALHYYTPKNMHDKDKRPTYFGATYMTMNNPYFEVINSEIRDLLLVEGDELITMDPVLSLDRQIEQIRYLIKEDVKVIFLNPVDKSGLHDVLEECKKANIKVIVLDTNVEEKDYYSTTIVSDNYDAGVQAAKDMMSRMDSAQIVLMKHSEAMSAYQRIQGFIDTIKEYPQYQIVGSGECKGQLELSMPIVEEMISMGLNFNVIMALNDPAAMGCLAALQEAGREGVTVYGIDGTPETKQLIAIGKMHGTIAQSPLTIAKKAVESAYDLLNDEKVDKEQIIPVSLITKENIEDYNLEGWQ